MVWTTQKDQLLVDYVTNYYQNLKDTRVFYKNLEWNNIYDLVGITDQEFLRLKIDEIYDNIVSSYMSDEFNIDELVTHWRSKKNPIFQEVAQMIEVIGLDLFKLEEEKVNDTPKQEEDTKNEEGQVKQSKKIVAPPVPKLTKTERRLSLDLMHSGPSLGINRESQLSKPSIASTTNINVLAKSETTINKSGEFKQLPLQKKRFPSKPQLPTTSPHAMIRKRRTSMVDEQLPLYIRNQLNKNRPRQKLTPKPSKHQITKIPSADSSSRGSLKKPSRLQNLVSNSQSLYAHTKDVTNSAKASPVNTFDSEQRSHYYSDESDDDDDDNKEYISPDSLTRYFGLHIEHEEEGEHGVTDDEEDEEDDEEEDDDDDEDHDFVNVGDDDDDYLFKI
ncbi:hypothetical protein SBY92_001548 [Candida maltosa Xu316]